MATVDTSSLLTSIREQRDNNPLSILTLAEPLLTDQTQSPNLKTDKSNESSSHSDSGATAGHLNPSTLTADLQHYRDLFSKLRFSYLEQVTKEKYLRSIVGDPPVLVTHDENLALEDKLALMKAELKTKKEENERLVQEMEELAGRLAEQYEVVNEGIAQIETLPSEIAHLEAQVAEVKEALRTKEEEMEMDGTSSDNPRMNMSLDDTQAALEEQRRKMKEVDEQIAALQNQLPGKMRECERAERDLEELEGRRNEATRSAREMQRIKEEGGRDMLEDRGRWLRAEEQVMRGLLGIGVES